MKQLLFLLLFPCLAMAQYTGNAGQKITLGEQTTADGLVYRGVASIDTVTATSKITRANKQDTSAFILLDTVTNLLWHYKTASNGWIQAGGGVSVSSFSAGTTGLTPSDATTGAVTLGGTLAVANGGTGATTFTAASRIPYASSATALTTNSNFKFEGDILYIPSAIFNGGTNYGYTFAAKALTSSSGAGIFIRGAQDADTTLPITFGYPYVNIGGSENRLNAIQTIGFGFTNGEYFPPAEIGYITNSVSGFTNGHLVFATRASTSNVAPDEKMRITTDGKTLIGYTTDQGAYPLQVNGQIFATNATIATSDEKFKENIIPLNKGLEIVNKLKPVTFNFIPDTKNKFSEYEEVGFIAQDVDRALSTETFAKSIVKSADDSEPTSTMGLATQNLIPILVKAIQEQQALIKALEQRILILENK